VSFFPEIKWEYPTNFQRYGRKVGFWNTCTRFEQAVNLGADFILNIDIG
jgi:hypothetical protein